MRVLVVALTTYTSRHNRARLPLLASRLDALHVLAGDVQTMWGRGVPAEGEDAYTLTLLAPYLDGSPSLMALRGLHRGTVSFRPDLVHVEAEPWQALAVQTVLVARSRRLPVGVALAENGPGLSGVRGLLRRLVARQVLRRCTYAVGWSEESSQVARRLGPPGLLVATVPGTGVDETQVRTVLGARPVVRRDSGCRVVFVGRLEPEKGVMDLLTAADHLAGCGHVEVVLAGAGSLQPVVEEWVAARTWATFLGLLERPEVLELYADADVVVLPSRTTPSWSEQFGKALVEAMAVGATVVAYDSGAIPEVLGEAGVLVPEGDVDALAKAVGDVLADPERRAGLGAAAAVRATRFAERALAERLLEVWQQALADSAGRPGA